MNRSAKRVRLGWLLALGAAALTGLGLAAVLAVGNRTETPSPWVRTYGSAPPKVASRPVANFGEDLPTLVVVTIDGPRSVATFRMPDGTLRPIRLDAELRPRWRLTALDTGAAILTTPHGPLRIPLVSDPMAATLSEDEALPRLSPQDTEDAPEVGSDGAPLHRCTEPEC